jgi:UDP-N-acetylglucosamine--N-acetylmuramyl-(pentapeptide) pyrophosphoryl-undecaprenol N-acetylglucosamine transferase
MRVVLTTGGTGGHIFPALAVAEVLRGQGVECLFVGSEYGPERRLAGQAGIEFAGLPVRGVLGRGPRALIALGRMGLAVGKAVPLLGRWRPDVVAGFGAYASCAAILAAGVLGVPILVHEQNAWPGLVNRLAGRLAAKICLSVPDGEGVFAPEKCVHTGNPVRASILAAGQSRGNAGREPRLLVLGGSQGAKILNTLILGSLPRLLEAGVSLRHQTGLQDLERVRAGYSAFGADVAMVSPFSDDMAAAYAWADIVLCRAGAGTAAELAVAGKPAVFIPFARATHDHQTGNARAVCRAGAAEMFTERELAEKDAVGALISLARDKDRLAAMGRAARALARPDAAAAVAREILGLGSRRLRGG